MWPDFAAWTQAECRQLWNDILEAGENTGIREHFLGSVIYLAAGEAHVTQWSPLLVYDGQQRLTTVSLILEVLARHLDGGKAPDGFEPGEIRNGYLLNGHCKGERHYRLVLKPGDAETLLALVHRRPLPPTPSPRILDAFEIFRKLIARLGPDVSALCTGLCKLRIVDIALKEGEDNPQRIFETMNACGRALDCADLIGNFILMPLDRERQKRLHEDHLQPIESGFARHPGDCQRRRDYAPERRSKSAPGSLRQLVPVVHGRAPRAGRRALRAAGGGPRVGGACGPTGASGVIRKEAGAAIDSA